MGGWVDLFIRRSLQATYNNLFYQIHFIVFIVRFRLLFFFVLLLNCVVRWTHHYTEMDKWLCQTNEPVNTTEMKNYKLACSAEIS